MEHIEYLGTLKPVLFSQLDYTEDNIRVELGRHTLSENEIPTCAGRWKNDG